jgi:DivIVA domain-containing protein
MQVLLVLAAALTVAAVVFGIAVLLTGDRHGLWPAEPDSRAVPLPVDRPLVEQDLGRVRFDTAVRGYRMGQVDAALRRAAYDIGYKDELIKVLQAEIVALREGRFPDAEVLRRAREAAAAPGPAGEPPAELPPAGKPPAEPPPAEPPVEPPVEPPPAGDTTVATGGDAAGDIDAAAADTTGTGETMPGGAPAPGRR